MTRKPNICFVTNELFPLGPGGIGRMLYNFAIYNRDNGFPVEIHYLLDPELVDNADSLTTLQQAFDGLATLHIARPLQEVSGYFAALMDRAIHQHWTLGRLVAVSYQYMEGLIEAERAIGNSFDVIEFPDYGGWGHASIEAKRAGIHFDNTIISVRLHSTQGILTRAERFTPPALWGAVLIDAERHLLAHADLVIGHNRKIIDFTAEHYDLVERWKTRSILEFPPILLEDYEQNTEATKNQKLDTTNFIFSSRLQHVKRPDLFIRAAIAFIEKHPTYYGVFRLVCGGWDQEYITSLEAIVPPDLTERVLFIKDATATERVSYIADSIVVITSDFESLCLFAFEASNMRRKIILNKKCPAFAPGGAWEHEKNCLLFDGTVDDLVKTLEKSIDWMPSEQATITPDIPYWAEPTLINTNTSAYPAEDRPEVSISVACFGFESREHFWQHFNKIIFQEHVLNLENKKDEIVFFLPRSLFQPGGREESQLLKRGWRAVFTSGWSECPEMLHKRFTELTRDCILLYPYGYELNSHYLIRGRETMTRDQTCTVFGGQVELFDPRYGFSDELRIYGGEMPSLALISSRIAPRISLLRRSLLQRHGFDARAGDLWLQVFFRECAIARESMIIAPMVAGSADPFDHLRPETTKRIAAGIFDSMGIKAGLSPRLLAIEPSIIPTESDMRPHVIDGESLASLRRIHPTGRPRNFEPVVYLPPHWGTMIHPLNSELVLAEIDAPPFRMSHIEINFHNIRAENQGIEAAIACVSRSLSAEKLLPALSTQTEQLPRGVSRSGWVHLAPLAHSTCSLAVNGSSRGDERIVILSRLPENADEAFAHLIVDRIVIWPAMNVF